MLSEEIKNKIDFLWSEKTIYSIDIENIQLIKNPVALGIYLFVKSYEQNLCHDCSKEAIKYFFKIGINKIDKALKELKDAGFFKDILIRNSSGRFIKQERIFK